LKGIVTKTAIIININLARIHVFICSQFVWVKLTGGGEMSLTQQQEISCAFFQY
jgi:hypothetical protein